MSVALLLSAMFDLAWRALGPPFMLFVLAPATLAAGLTSPVTNRLQGRSRIVLVTLGFLLAAGIVIGLIPLETSDRFNGYRIFGVLTYGVPGVLWAVLGLIGGGSNDAFRPRE